MMESSERKRGVPHGGLAVRHLQNALPPEAGREEDTCARDCNLTEEIKVDSIVARGGPGHGIGRQRALIQSLRGRADDGESSDGISEFPSWNRPAMGDIAIADTFCRCTSITPWSCLVTFDSANPVGVSTLKTWIGPTYG